MAASAQYVERKAVDSTTAGTKYITFEKLKKGITGFSITAIKDSGTVGGTITLERRLDSLPTKATAVWKQVGTQSYTLTNTSGAQGDIFPVEIVDGVAYRFKIVATGGKVFLRAAYMYW